MTSTTMEIDKRCQGKPAPKIIDAVRINDHYFDSEAIKEKAAGILYFSLAACAIAATCFLAMI